MVNKWTFEPILKQHQRKDFDCGYPSLNLYLRKYARQNHEKNIAKAYVARRASPTICWRVNGYYTISTSTIEFASIPESYQQGMPKYPIPSALIGRLAVDNAFKGKGLGTELLVDALLRIVRVSIEIGVFAVRVDAIDDSARNFYLKHEFIPFQDQSLSLFLPLETVKKEFLI